MNRSTIRLIVLVAVAVAAATGVQAQDKGAAANQRVGPPVPPVERGGVNVYCSTPQLAIPDNDAQGVSSEIQIQQEGVVKNVAVEVDISHTYIGDLRIDLVSPAGQFVRLHDNAGGPANDIKKVYDSTSTPDLSDLVGESTQGNWQLRVRDLAAFDVGTLHSWSITLDT